MDEDFDIPSQCNCTKIRRAARHITRFYDACLAPSGIRATQYTILGFLKHRGPKTMLDLAAIMAMDRATIGHNLRPLERDGLVTILVNEDDRRSRIAAITPAGLERIAQGRPGWDHAQAEVARCFGSDQTAALRRMMDGVVACELDLPAPAPRTARRPSSRP